MLPVRGRRVDRRKANSVQRVREYFAFAHLQAAGRQITVPVRTPAAARRAAAAGRDRQAAQAPADGPCRYGAEKV